MRNKVIAAILSAFVLLIISCSSVDNKAPEALVAKVAAPKSRKITKTFVAKKSSKENSHKAPALNSRANEISNYASCLLYTSDAADERSSVDLGGRRIIKK